MRQKLRNLSPKSRGLLDMYYKPGEICEEIGVDRSTLQSWITNGGLPVLRDNGRVFISGFEFTKWVLQLQKKDKRNTIIGKEEAFCMKCNKPTLITDAQRKKENGCYLIKGRCQLCGSKVNKGIAHDKQRKLLTS